MEVAAERPSGTGNLGPGRHVTFYNAATQRFFATLQTSGSVDQQQALDPRLDLVKSAISGQLPLSQVIKQKKVIGPEDQDSARFVYNNGQKTFRLELKNVAMARLGSASPVIEYMVHDITALEELEHARAQHHCLHLLVSTASHDIRTPINAIQGVIEMLEPQSGDEETRNSLHVARVAVQRLLLYVRGLSYLQQIELGTPQAERASFDLPRLVRDVCGYYEQAVNVKSIQINVTCESLIPLAVSDKEKLEIVVYHVLENAVKYTMTGRIEVRISFGYSPGENFAVTVHDTGVGIPANQLPHLFKLFARQRGCDSAAAQGIGLGLFMAHSLVSLLGGALAINSIPGTGTTVKFHIAQTQPPPQADTDADAAIELLDEGYDHRPLPSMTANCGLGSSTRDRRSYQRDLSSDVTMREVIFARFQPSPRTIGCTCPQILLVDDEPFNLFVLGKFLASAGLRADTATNGQQAVDAVTRRRKECSKCGGYRVIFMDINMSVMDGIAATERIHALAAAGNIPTTNVVAVTAAAQFEDPGVVEQFQKSGFKEMCIRYRACNIWVVQKPVTKTGFLNVLEMYLY